MVWSVVGWVGGWILYSYNQLSSQLKLEVGLSLAILALDFKQLKFLKFLREKSDAYFWI